jgi:hypothetical protein
MILGRGSKGKISANLRSCDTLGGVRYRVGKILVQPLKPPTVSLVEVTYQVV